MRKKDKRKVSAVRAMVLFFIAGAISAGMIFAPVVVFSADSKTTILGNSVHGEGTQFQQFTKEFGVGKYEDVKQPGVIVQNIVAIMFGVLGLIAVVMIIYAGFLWLTAGGEEEKAKQGKTLLFQAVIGLIIILSAYTVTYFVLRQLILAIVG